MVNTNGGCANHLPGPNPPYSQAPGALGGAWANRSQRVTYIKQITVSPPGETTLASTLRFPASVAAQRFAAAPRDDKQASVIVSGQHSHQWIPCLASYPPVPALRTAQASRDFTPCAVAGIFLPTRHSLELSCRQGVSTLAVHTTTGAAMFSNT